MAVIAFSLRGRPEAAQEARRRVDHRLGTACRMRHVALLLLTELVTNAVRHGGATNGEMVEVTVTRSPDRLMVTVTNPGVEFEWRGREPSRPLRAGGYGLLLVDRMAERWGIERTEDSTTVWFELVHPALALRLRRGEAPVSECE